METGMKIERSKVEKLTITGAPSLDPITVYAEDIGPRQGKITIECYGKSWSAYWGGCGDKGVAAFFRSCNADYIANCLDRGIEASKYDASEAGNELKKIVIERRRLHDNWRPGSLKNWDYDFLDRHEARELWSRMDSEHFYEDPAGNANLFSAVTGHEEWWNAIPTTTNPAYVYLCRIVRAVQQAFAATHDEAKTPAAEVAA
jgi:hypothetical protein